MPVADPSYTIVVLVTNVSLDAPQFSQADVTGSWRSASLLIPSCPAFLPDTLDGTITFDDEGGIASWHAAVLERLREHERSPATCSS